MKLTIKAKANLEILLAQSIFFSKKVFIKNSAIHARYRIHNIMVDDENIPRKKCISKKISNHRLRNSNIRENRFGRSSIRSYREIFR